MRVTGNQPVSSEKLALARKFRKEMTPSERMLWRVLRTNKLEGLHFRRQQLIAGFIVDFYCASRRLAVEVDGPSHLATKGYDVERDRVLAELLVRTLRLSNEEIAADLPKALQRIAQAARSLK